MGWGPVAGAKLASRPPLGAGALAAGACAALLVGTAGCSVSESTYEPGWVTTEDAAALTPGDATSSPLGDAAIREGTAIRPLLPGAPGSVSASGSRGDARSPDAGDASAALSGGDGGSEADAECPAGTFQGGCYRVETTPVVWQEASDRCVAWGGQLVVLDTPGEEAFLEAALTAAGVTPELGGGTWLGLLEDPMGTLRWLGGAPVGEDANWGPAQPDDAPGPECVEKRNEPGGGWYDRRCDELLRFACERPLAL